MTSCDSPGDHHITLLHTYVFRLVPVKLQREDQNRGGKEETYFKKQGNKSKDPKY